MSLTYGLPMEAADRRIIELLRGDGRMSYTDLGKAVGLSTSAVHQRVRRLEELLARVRSEGGVSTRTTIVLTTPWE